MSYVKRRRMESCKIACAGQPACKLGSLTKFVQVAGEELAACPTPTPDAPNKHKIMVICKAPDNMDRQTVGNGRNLDKLKDLLALATISTADVYVTGLVKCCPPKRPAAVGEVKACMGHLADELRAVDPDVVVLMGAATLRAFNLMGEGGIYKLHGQIFKRTFPHDDTLTKEYNVVVTTDPNALFMNPDPRLEGNITKDLRVAKSCVEGELINPDAEDTKYKLIEGGVDLAWMIEQIQEKGMFSFDTESRALPWSDEPMICMQFCWGYGEDTITSAVLPFYNHDPEGTDWKLKATWNQFEREGIIKLLKVIFEDANIPKVAHNIKYDMCVLRKHCGIEVKGFLFDTMLMHHLLWEHPPHDLEYLSDLELNTGDYSKELHKITGHGKVLKNTYDYVPDLMMWLYGSKDAENTYRLFCRYYPRLKENEELWKLYLEEVHPFIRTLLRAEWYGVRLCPDVIDALTEEFSKERDALLVSLKDQTWPEFNPDAHNEVAQAIQDAGFGRDIEDKRKAKGYCTDKARLLKLVDKLPLVADIMRFRSLTKLVGTYMNNAKLLTKGDGRARIGVMIHGTVNGRVAVPFLHQIPRLDHDRIAKGLGNLRDMFIANQGYKVVYGDFSQIELVTLAICSGDKNMLEVFRSGQDIHRATAAAFLEMEDDQVNDHNRNLAKPVNFSRIYGAVEGKSLMKETWQDLDGKTHPVTQEMVARGYASLDARFPAAAEYFKTTVAEISANAGTLVTPFGRIKHMGTTMNSGNEWARANAERQAVNGSIQSPANSVTVRCLNAVDDYLMEQIEAGVLTDEEAFLILTVHDSGAWEVKDEHVDWFVPKIREISNLPVPQLDDFQFTMKVGVGNSWSEAELNAT
jgi:DNA polymerase-1